MAVAVFTHPSPIAIRVNVRQGPIANPQTGFDQRAGHSLLLLYDVKTPHGQKVKEFNGLWNDPYNTSLSLL